MAEVIQIVEMDQERDRKTCVQLDLKVTGANRELAQWIADHRGKYTSIVIASWLGCSDRRIRYLREWAEGGFKELPRSTQNRKEQRRNGGSTATLKSLDNFEDEDSEGIEVAEPEMIEDHVLHFIKGVNENFRVFKKVIRASALDREAVGRISTALDRMMSRLRSFQSTLAKKDQIHD